MPEPSPTLWSLGERAFVARLRGRLPSRADLLVGAGDDCAVAAAPGPGLELVFKSDPVSCFRHFLPETDPRLVGRKALGRVLSDFASMGAEPRWALVDFAAPPDTPVAAADGYLDGICEMARRFGVAVAGGDTSEGPVAELHVFAAGVVPSGAAMLRSAARPGDAVFCTGALGRSLESGRHLAFEPRVAEGRWLRERGVRCCIDVSDGLGSELWLLADASGAAIDADPGAIPLSPACAAMPDPLAHALGDGEDFELLFAATPDIAARLEAEFPRAFPGTPLSRIGRVAAAPGGSPRVTLGGEPLPRGGYEHFAASANA